MPFVPVPKDLTKVKSKVVFGLTVRQLVCFGAGGLAGIPAYLLTRGSIGNDAAAMLMIGLMHGILPSPTNVQRGEQKAIVMTIERVLFPVNIRTRKRTMS